jgi:hypothetical protein
MYGLDGDTRLVPLSYFWTCWNVMPATLPRSGLSDSTFVLRGLDAYSRRLQRQTDAVFRH